VPFPAQKPEVMSPAGYWPQLNAAIEAGADAVYFGLKHFTARAKVGFEPGELADVMRTLHRRGVRGFVTFNTLVFEEEVQEAAEALTLIAKAGADAIIVQDLGVLSMAQAIAPDLEIHASTQMSVTDAHGANLAQRLGARRVTLARELSLDEIRAIRQATTAELEVFVHGALCVAYSGQCFSSEAWGGRSANRGQCAQACRLPYEMYVDGVLKPLGDARYLLSPGDLYALHQIPELIEIGINTFKIEGRYKDADYVAATTRAYREAVDAAWTGRPLLVPAKQELELEQIYSRGLGPFFLNGTNHQVVVRGRAPRHRGVLMGRVVRVAHDAVVVKPEKAHLISPLKPGDGVVFDAADWRSPEEPEEGGRLFEVNESGNGCLELRFGRDSVDADRVRPGDLVWRTDDPAVQKLLRVYTGASTPVQKQSVNVTVTATPGEPLRTVWRVASRIADTVVHCESAEPVLAAANRPLTAAALREQFSRLGNTPYELGEVVFDATSAVFVPISALNQLRREAVDKLAELQAKPPARALRPFQAPPAATGMPESAEAPRVHVLLRTAEQLEAAIAARPASITLDYLDLYGLKPSVELVRAAGIEVRVASPRILKPGEERIADFLIRLDCPILVRPAGLLDRLHTEAKHALTGDFSLNAANALTARTLLDMGLQRITPTHDLNAVQVAQLARQVGGLKLEAIVYQHLPVFHTEHCVFCRFLSTGTSYKDCGRPCEEHRLELGDPSGRKHPVLADVGCRNTIFGAEAQEASAHLENWLEAGIRHFRIEFAHESPRQVTEVIEAFEAVLSGESTPRQLRAVLRRIAPQGITQGSLFVPIENLSRPASSASDRREL